MGANEAGQIVSTQRSLAANRLRPPLLPRTFVSRVPLLDKARDAKYVAVVAPGGYGKTCFLADLATKSGRSAWYTVRSEDADPSVFAFGLASALAGISPEDSQVQALLSVLSAATPDVAADLLVQLASAIPGPYLLALDDCHMLGTESVSLTVLDRFLTDAPAGLSFAYSGRTSLSLSVLSRAEAAGLLVEIGSSELRFDVGAAIEALRDEGLSGDQIGEITRLCEGWPVLVRLAATLLARDGESLTSIAGDRQTLYTYIATELFGKLTPSAQNLLLRTSCCPEFTVPLADHLVDSPTPTLIRKVEGEGWLQRTKTASGATYSYHPLLAEFLWTRFSTETPSEQVKSTLIRAGEWMASQKRWDEAFEFWKRAGATRRVVDQLYTWEIESIEYWPAHGRWLNTMTLEELGIRPRLLLRKALGYQLGCNANEAFRWQAMAEEAISKSGDEEGILDARINRAQLNFFAQNLETSEQMYEALEKEEASLNDRQKVSTYAGLALVEMQRCENLDRALNYLERVLTIATATQNWRSVALAVGNLMTTHRLRGAYPQALRLAEEYGRETGGAYPVMPRLYLVMVLAAHAMDYGLDEAETYLQEAVTRCKFSNYNWLAASLQAARALHHAERGFPEAEAAIEEGARIPTTHKGVAHLIDVARATLAARKGNYEEALRCLDRVQPSYSSMSSYEPSAAYAYLLIGERQTAAARALEAAAQGRRRGMRFIEACALFMLTAADGATTKDMQRLMDLSKELGYEPMILNRWPELAPKVLTQALARNVEPEYTIKLLRQTGAHTLRVQTFGGLRVWLNDEELDDQAWERPKSKALFAYLLIRDGKPAHSEEIAELFWPDQDLSAAKNSLRVAATRVRKAIEREDKRLLFEADQYRLDLGNAAWDDRQAFEQLLEAGLSAEESELAIDLLDQALALFSDDFLPEYRYEEWAATERERLETLRRRARLRLGKHLITVNRSGEAIRVCEAATSSDPLDEAAVRLMIVALSEMDRPDEARRVFLRLQNDLSKQLNSKPTAATLKLVRELGVA